MVDRHDSTLLDTGMTFHEYGASGYDASSNSLELIVARRPERIHGAFEPFWLRQTERRPPIDVMGSCELKFVALERCRRSGPDTMQYVHNS